MEVVINIKGSFVFLVSANTAYIPVSITTGFLCVMMNNFNASCGYYPLADRGVKYTLSTTSTHMCICIIINRSGKNAKKCSFKYANIISVSVLISFYYLIVHTCIYLDFRLACIWHKHLKQCHKVKLILNKIKLNDFVSHKLTFHVKSYLVHHYIWLLYLPCIPVSQIWFLEVSDECSQPTVV